VRVHAPQVATLEVVVAPAGAAPRHVALARDEASSAACHATKRTISASVPPMALSVASSRRCSRVTA
jgi:hypothetical protein